MNEALRRKRLERSLKIYADEEPKILVEAKSAKSPKKSTKEIAPYTLFRKSGVTSDWDDFFMDARAIEWVCPVDFFPNAPFSPKWKQFACLGAKIEVEHPQSVGDKPLYCVATIVHFAGYKALVRFEGLKNKESAAPPMKTWISYCSTVPKPLGYSLSEGYLLWPVEGYVVSKPGSNFKSVNEAYIKQEFDPIEMLKVQTISPDHGFIVEQELRLTIRHYRLSQIVEVMDPEYVHRNLLAFVRSITGDRLALKFMDIHGERTKGEIFVSAKSDTVHPFGWSHTVGQELVSNLPRDIISPKIPEQLIPTYPTNIKISEGMVFEVRHPLMAEKIVPATVLQKLKFGHFMGNVISCKNIHSFFVIHINSDYLLPCGFSKRHNIPLEDPSDESSFTWNEYFEDNPAVPLDLSALQMRPPHKFEKGHKFEAVDARDTSYLGPVTVLDVCEHLLFIHFDGWARDNPTASQWISALSPDIYPAGYAEMVGHVFRGRPELPNFVDQYSVAK